jgi:TPR repeat protein
MAYSDTAIDPAGTLGAHSDAQDLYQAGLNYAIGVDTDIDLVKAHSFFNLAAVRGHEEAKIQRAEMADLLSSDELKMALQAAREWLKLAN